MQEHRPSMQVDKRGEREKRDGGIREVETGGGRGIREGESERGRGDMRGRERERTGGYGAGARMSCDGPRFRTI